MKNKIEERFTPPFEYYKHAVSGYVVRPLNWAGIWKDGFIFVSGNVMLNCANEEDAKMIADTFNRFFELLKRNKELELENQKLDSCLTEYTSLYKEQLNINRKARDYLKNITTQLVQIDDENSIDYGEWVELEAISIKEITPAINILNGDDD